MQYTSNYNLRKPEGTDIVNIDDLNYNADILDQKLKEVENKADNAPPNSVNDAAIGSRTPDQSQAPASPGTGTLTQLISWLANRIKAITGKTNWWDAPPTTLQAAKTHLDAAAPHSGHETPAGAQTKADAAEARAKAYTDQEVTEVAQELAAHKANTANPHNVTKSQIGLGNVDNIKQASKTEFDSHNNDTTRHITAEERTRWNNKAEVSQIPTKVSQLENDRGYVTQEELGDVGYGDMLKSVYDTNDDGKVDVAETVIGNEIQLGSYKLVYNFTTNSLDIGVIS